MKAVLGAWRLWLAPAALTVGRRLAFSRAFDRTDLIVAIVVSVVVGRPRRRARRPGGVLVLAGSGRRSCRALVVFAGYGLAMLIVGRSGFRLRLVPDAVTTFLLVGLPGPGLDSLAIVVSDRAVPDDGRSRPGRRSTDRTLSYDRRADRRARGGRPARSLRSVRRWWVPVVLRRWSGGGPHRRRPQRPRVAPTARRDRNRAASSDRAGGARSPRSRRRSPRWWSSRRRADARHLRHPSARRIPARSESRTPTRWPWPPVGDRSTSRAPVARVDVSTVRARGGCGLAVLDGYTDIGWAAGGRLPDHR